MKRTASFSSRRFLWKWILLGTLFFLGGSLTVLSLWYRSAFNMPFKELLFTMLSPLQGTGQSTVQLVLTSCLPAVLCLLAVTVLAVWRLVRDPQRYPVLRRVAAWVCVASFVGSLVLSVLAFRIPEYLSTLSEKTLIYEEYYVDPNTVSITAEGKTKNLIYIFVESMETTYASEEEGGAQGTNFMPSLTALAKENLSFSDSELLGGFHTPSGTGWTMGALMGMTSGVPYSLAVLGEQSHNSMSKYQSFAPGLTTLGDLLKKYGYKQEFLCGSDASFAGRDHYFEQHGGYEIFDLYTAREKDYIEDDYYVWWGFEDQILFEIAKDEILELASNDAPFNFTMLTVDTHHVNGYLCDVCQKNYGNKLANVVSCTDRQVSEFVQWCQQQDFYEDTVIVIAGDHPRMDTTLVSGVDYYDRTMYNCIINADVPVQGDTQNRVFTTFDLFPTTLAAMGFTIEGDRLGFGTNLFSSLPTLAEEKGYEWLDTEISKYSSYYVKHFS